MAVAKKQAREKKRRQAPQFAAVAVSNYGELAPATCEMVEWIVQKYRENEVARSGDCLDGFSVIDRVRVFRKGI